MLDVNDHMVCGILDWVTLLELSMGPVTITLLSAAFTEEDDNISFALFRRVEDNGFEAGRHGRS